MNIDDITRLSFRLAWRYKTISIQKNDFENYET